MFILQKVELVVGTGKIIRSQLAVTICQMGESLRTMTIVKEMDDSSKCGVTNIQADVCAKRSLIGFVHVSSIVRTDIDCCWYSSVEWSAAQKRGEFQIDFRQGHETNKR